MCMHVCVVYLGLYMFICRYISIYVCIYMYVYVYVFIYVDMFVCVQCMCIFIKTKAITVLTQHITFDTMTMGCFDNSP
jgi:hypothetical protein